MRRPEVAHDACQSFRYPEHLGRQLAILEPGEPGRVGCAGKEVRVSINLKTAHSAKLFQRIYEHATQCRNAVDHNSPVRRLVKHPRTEENDSGT
jgi:hypothetical protein